MSLNVSIVIPVYNNFDMTKKCIDSVNNAMLETSYEIIIADDGSSDETLNIEKYYDNVRLIKNPENSGFLLNVKNALQYVNGDYILLMNNDMIAKPKFLDYLYKTIVEDENIGLAGAMMLNEDDTIQEIGGSAFIDGSTEWNCYRYKETDLTQIYEVDYCSGCGIMFSKSDWDKLGGFDETYKPAYYEDVDLCYQIRYILGKKVVCQPKAQIYHLIGKTYKTCSDREKLMQTNRAVFLKKWGDKLCKRTDFPPNTFWENLFSVKRNYRRYAVTFLGIRITFKPKKFQQTMLVKYDKTNLPDKYFEKTVTERTETKA